MSAGFQHTRLIHITLLATLLAVLPACSANAGFKRKSRNGEASPSVVAAPPSGRVAQRPAGYSWWNRPREFYPQGYAGANYDLQTRTQLRETRYQRKATGHETHGH